MFDLYKNLLLRDDLIVDVDTEAKTTKVNICVDVDRKKEQKKSL